MKGMLSQKLIKYYSYKDELTIHEGIILRGARIVVPKEMRDEMLNKIHIGHQGINSCLRRARELIYWPGMSKEIRNYIDTFGICATNSVKQQNETGIEIERPDVPWVTIGMDLFKHNNKNYLVTVDYCSNYIEVDYVRDTLADTIITKCKANFARWGFPLKIISDNGPQFSSYSFKKFTYKYDITHNTILPWNSMANGKAEAAVKVIKNIFIKSQVKN